VSKLGSMLELLFYAQLQSAKLHDDCVRELVFAPPRKWRFDFAWPEQRIAVEIEGGSWVQGAHVRGGHFESDIEKYNAATERGWQVYRFSSDMVEDGSAIRVMRRILERTLGSGNVASG